MLYTEQRKEGCCGCTACTSICPRNAVSMEQDERGFFYPSVDSTKCIHCGLCQKVCPMQMVLVGQNAEPATYAVRSRDISVRKDSSSGGVFSSIMEWCLEKNGTIYGAAFDENFHVLHMRASNKRDAAKFRTSKYVDSDLTGVLSDLQKDLNDGKTVVMSGRPCQICAVNKYLSIKKVDTDNLITCDVICHGVPSRKLWEDYLSIIRNKYMDSDDHIRYINMRSKRKSWKKQVMELQTEKEISQDILDGFSFNQFYLSLYGNRPSCFHCPFTSYERTGDFTLGDFWNEEKADIQFNTGEGISAVLVNTAKGEKVFNEYIQQNTDCQRVTKQAVWQPYLEYSANAPKKYDEFWREYLNSGSDSEKEIVFRRYMKGSALTRVIHLVSPLLRKIGLYSFAGKFYRIVFARKNNE